MPEIAYRKALVRKHVTAAKIMRLKGLPDEAVDRERELIALMWGQYRAIKASRSL
jgi:hypothetical protein